MDRFKNENQEYITTVEQQHQTTTDSKDLLSQKRQDCVCVFSFLTAQEFVHMLNK